VIREHREKLFLCHLRLGPLSPKEAGDLGYRFSREALAPPNRGSRPGAGARNGDSTGAGDAGQQRGAAPRAGGGASQDEGTDVSASSSSTQQEQNTTAVQAPMTEDEATLLRDRLFALRASRQVTPRNIRSLILRYQLARNLVRAGSRGATPDRKTLEQIVDTLIGSTFGGRAVLFDRDAAAREDVSYVIAQVS
jgi:hypothetical protein